MRPRHKAAENEGAEIDVTIGVGIASMRPRHKAAENLQSYALDVCDRGVLQ